MHTFSNQHASDLVLSVASTIKKIARRLQATDPGTLQAMYECS